MPESGPVPAGAQHSVMAPQRRSPFADALRGFALVGICVVNLPWLASSAPGTPSALDGAARLLVLALFEGKFFVLFSLLFGFGFQRQLGRVRAGRATPASYARRLVGLFVLGALHATLLYVGDILVAYALLGAALWAVRDLPDDRLLSTAGACVAVAAVAFAVLSWGGSGTGGGEGGAAVREAARQAYLGDFAQALEQRLKDLPFGLLIVLLFNWPLAFAAFCVGLVAGRRGLLGDPARLARALPPVPLLAVGAVIGNAASAAAYRLPGGWLSGGAGALLAVGAPCLSALYLLALARAWRAPRARAFMERWLAPAGRMSLSNYLGQSLVANLLFMGWGFGLYGSLGAAALLPISLAIAAAGLVASAFWLRRFRAGPAERLLRAWVRPASGA